MRHNLVFPGRESKPLAAEGLLKATSLLYLKDALQKERYEECAALIQVAKSYGADSGDIGRAIAEALRKFNSGQGGASLTKGRRFT